jgi:hypothetical protein
MIVELVQIKSPLAMARAQILGDAKLTSVAAE